MNSILIFCTTCRKYLIYGAEQADEYDLSSYTDYSSFYEDFLKNNEDEAEPELDILDIDDSSNWPFIERIPSSSLISQFIYFLNLEEEDQKILADYMEASGQTADSLEELMKFEKAAHEKHVAREKDFFNFAWDEMNQALASCGVADEKARRYFLNRMDIKTFEDELKESYGHGSNGNIFLLT